mmetsp:Transcript_31159/g.81705  ORF Transcript_31159/g.81705 Transcript_31159/m.81705 type:complete len:456 (+) Transcript_31159:35-1402(+)|eukprot:CAMPEP_0182925218 /NCGR_PEP_ID=MMETSP0105_2-20130417/8628_1 /TAXON_ID=81532 ORGANISM="Acanthoeca-like sp., Strain 10tr" /NCGR_SAMPLE_ID=MMETSP0105_2 /ASSEMBLY_ACC=CAM_ASM_000205 /LENGTH=455 /DNA_ID=CAMNT_0025063055 /DNA_START=34 /DNA_END=1401 /DNA_ORIENTATION=+
MRLARVCKSAEAAASYRSSLLRTPETKVSTLPNGLRVATETTPHKTATVGLYIDAGSRFESAKNNGTAHFLEHMAFKGTGKRSQYELEIEVENMGMLFNAYTAREQTVYFAKCFSKDVGHATEILSDLTLNCTLDDKAVEAERSVIIRENDEVNDQPEEVVLDHLHATAFQGHSLGYTILGPVDNIKSITQADLRDYITTNYTAPRIVLAAAGGIEHEEVVAIADKYFGSLSGEHNAQNTDKPSFVGSEIRARDDSMDELHVGLAVEGCGWNNPDYFPLMLASTMVGSWDKSFTGGANMSSALARRCAEYDIASKYQSYHTTYSDTGLWGIYGVCDRTKADDFIWAIQEEWIRVCEHANDDDVARAKAQFKAALFFQNDGTTAICDEIGRQMLSYGRRMYAAEADARIEAVSVSQLREVAAKYIYDKCPAVVGVGPTEQIPDYNRIRGGMWWVTN